MDNIQIRERIDALRAEQKNIVANQSAENFANDDRYFDIAAELDDLKRALIRNNRRDS